MPITAVPSTVAANVYAIRPRVSVSVVDVASSVEYSLPAAAVDYIEIQLTVTAGTVSRNPYVRDTLVVLDERVINFAKIFSEFVSVTDLAFVGSLTSSNAADSASINELASKLTEKGFAENIGVIDALTLVTAFGQAFSEFFSVSEFVALDTAKNVIDSVSINDVKTLSIAKPQTDTVISVDLLNKIDVDKNVSEQITPVELLAKAFSRTLADTVTVTDVLDIFSFLGQNLFDSVEMVEAISGVSPSPGLSDTPTATDLLNLFITRVLADGVGMNDQADATDGFEFNFSTSFSNVTFTTEQKYLLLAKLFVDSFGTQDASSVSLAKLVEDQMQLADSVVSDVHKAAEDTATTSEETSREVDKQVQDAFSLVSAIDVLLAAAHYDVVSQQDSLSFVNALIKVDSQPILDALIFATEQLKVDSVVSLEALLYELSRQVSDSTQADDAATLAVQKKLSDALAVLDEASLSFAKYFSNVAVVTEALSLGYLIEASDGVGMNDGADTTDGIAFAFTQSFSNVAFVLESSIKSTSKTVSESISVGSTGIVVVQDYCDPSYFAEDYVGVSRNFT